MLNTCLETRAAHLPLNQNKYFLNNHLKITTTSLTSFQSRLEEYLSGTTRCRFIRPIFEPFS